MLEIGQSATATIHAKQFWNDTGIRLVAGQEYRLEAEGAWTDWRHRTDADGYDSPNVLLRVAALLRLRRAPREKWFALIGAVDVDPKAHFLIGRSRTLSAPTSGALRCFANDARGFYRNNDGAVELTVTRLR